LNVAIVHDYLTQRGGAERVVLAMLRAFPDAPVYTSMYHPDGTFPAFRDADVRVTALDRVRPLRRHHRLALPLLAATFSRLRVSADVAICSSSGWAHATSVEGKKVVYCHTPARWLYQRTTYLSARDYAARIGLALLRPYLVRWDRRAAATSDRYLANSSVVRDRIRAAYGIDADVVPPPPALGPDGVQRPVDGLEPGFYLCVSRLLAYKNVGAVAAAFADGAPGKLVIVGTGPEGAKLRAGAGNSVSLVGSVGDEQLRWLYSSCAGIVAASYEDYGLTPLEAAAFGKPAAVLRWGGFQDTVVDGTTGLFFDRPEPREIAAAVHALAARSWNAHEIAAHADHFSEKTFVERLRGIVEESVHGEDVA
jgi:glycosyltransferase involved in cell wall biosynthesis